MSASVCPPDECCFGKSSPAYQQRRRGRNGSGTHNHDRFLLARFVVMDPGFTPFGLPRDDSARCTKTLDAGAAIVGLDQLIVVGQEALRRAFDDLAVAGGD